MRRERPGVTKADEGLDGIAWQILGQTYVPKQVGESSFSWHATLPPGTGVPPHVHPTQDEFIYMLDGRLDIVLAGEESFALAGDLVRLPMGVPHGLFSRQETAVTCLFWVSPTRKLFDLFQAIHALPEQTPEAVVALAESHEVTFLPPE